MAGEGLGVREPRACSLRRLSRTLCVALLLVGAVCSARAALFDDDEARKQIAVERGRVDELQKQAEALNARIAKTEEALKGQGLLDLLNQIEALKQEVAKLRGQLEVIDNSVENTAKRQRDMYVDLDTRLRRLEQLPAAGTMPAVVPPDSKPAPTPAGAKPPGPSPATVAAADPSEGRAYEAAQSQRRIGNYQGAIFAFQNFVKQYPKSTLAPRAQYWIGDSYFNLRDFKSSIAAQQALVKTYPDSPSVPDALLNIASSQAELGDHAAAKKTMEEIVAKYPTSDAAEKAKRRLAAPK